MRGPEHGGGSVGRGPGDGGGPARGAGWRALRRERMDRFRPDFRRLRSSLRRTELFGSIIELFASALVGAGRIQLGGDDERTRRPPATARTDEPAPPSP